MGGMVKTELHTRDTIFEHAAVATDNKICSRIGKEILRNGSAVDAAIASLLCLGVINCHSTGIGGGGFMMVYQKEKKQAKVIDFREAAPGKAHKDLFDGNIENGIRGGLAVAIPGELRGMQLAHEKYGKLPWRDLFQPAIKIAEGGFDISESLAIALNKWKDDVFKDPGLREMFVNDNKLLQQGQKVRNLQLGHTLRIIAAAGNAEPFYTGAMAKSFEEEVKAQKGIVKAADLRKYKALLRDPLKSSLGESEMLNIPPPASGPVLTYILNILKGFHFKEEDIRNHQSTVLHKIIEAFKFAYARRQELADPAFEPTVAKVVKDLMNETCASIVRGKIHENVTFEPAYYGAKYKNKLTTGTTHLVVMAPNGDAVAVTSTVNGYLGAKFRSKKMGFIYNNEMDDFSVPGLSNEFGLPPSKVNYIKPFKRPQSSSVPVMILDSEKNVRFIAGGSGGSIITTAVAQVLMNHLWFGMNLKDAVQQPRVHAQLIPETIFAETRMPEDVVDKLRIYGHKVNVSDGSHAVVQAIARINTGWQKVCKKGKIHRTDWNHYCKGANKKTRVQKIGLFAESDYRKGGQPSGF